MIPGIVTLFMGIGNFALAIILALFSGWGFYGIAAAGAIVLTLKNAVFTPWYATKVLGVGVNTFTRVLLPGVIAGLLLWAFAVVLGLILPLNTIINLIVAGIILILGYAILMWRVGLSEGERNLFGSYVPVKIRRLIL
jgi:membrane protein EpsK